jgi:hypothetical protein
MQVLRVTMAWCWGGCETEGSRGALRPLEERGLHRDWRATSKKWALVQKSPPDHCALYGDERAGNDAERVDRAAEWVQAAIDRLQLGGRRFLCSDAVPVMATADRWEPEQETVTCTTCSTRSQAGTEGTLSMPIFHHGYCKLRWAPFYCVSTVSLLA